MIALSENQNTEHYGIKFLKFFEGKKKKPVNLEFYIQWKYTLKHKSKLKTRLTNKITSKCSLQEMLKKIFSLEKHIITDKNLYLHKQMRIIQNGKNVSRSERAMSKSTGRLFAI